MPTIWDLDEAERAKLNPWVDPAFNTCEVPFKEPGLNPDDIPDRIGLPVQNLSLEVNEIEGMTFLKLDDTPEAYAGHNKKYVQVQGESLGFKKVDTTTKIEAKHLIFKDLFRDESVHWAWSEWLGASATGKSITEEQDYIKIAVTATTHAAWHTTANEAPKIIIGVPGYPVEIIARLASWSENDDSMAGIFLSKNVSGTGGDTTMMFVRIRDDGSSLNHLQVNRVGTGSVAEVAWTAEPVWFRIRIGIFAWGFSNLVFSYSSDGDSWTDLYTLPQGVPLSLQFPTTIGVLATGCFVRNWTATWAAVNAKFDHFEMRRSLGPDGGS